MAERSIYQTCITLPPSPRVIATMTALKNFTTITASVVDPQFSWNMVTTWSRMGITIKMSTQITCFTMGTDSFMIDIHTTDHPTTTHTTLSIYLRKTNTGMRVIMRSTTSRLCFTR